MTHISQVNRVRIVVPTGIENYSLISICASIASFANAHLALEYLHDEALEDLAKLPFTTAIHHETAKITAIDAKSMGAAINKQIKKYQADLSRQAMSRKVEWSFRVVQKPMQLESEDPSGEVLAIPRQEFDWFSKTQFDAVRVALEQGQSVLIGAQKRSSRSNGEICVLVDQLENSRRSIDAAAELASKLQRTLVVVVGSAETETFKSAKSTIHAMHPELTDVELFPAGLAGFEATERVVSRLEPELVVIERKNEILKNYRNFRNFMKQVRSHVLIVGGV